jgi:putative tricarboxylic transport membrane protein
MGYNEARRFSKYPEEFGNGSIEGVAGSEAANNAVTGGSLIPTLTLGIPGESVTAVLMGGLIIHGLQPGPELFTTYAGMTYTFFGGFVFVQFAMLIIGLWGCRVFANISRLSDSILIPSIFILCVVGSYAIHNNFVEVIIMFIFGFIGYFVRKFDLNAAAIVLGLILGPIGENGLRRDSGGARRRGGVYRDELYRAQLDYARVFLQARPYGDASGSEGKRARPENVVRRKRLVLL